MSPIALQTPPILLGDHNSTPDLPRRPSPWTDLSHSLSETSLPLRKPSISTPDLKPNSNPIPTPNTPSPSPPLPALSTSQALREWEDLLARPDSAARRHQLVHHSPSPTPSVSGRPKLVAEQDKRGHIEYKLKLIDPTPERFERLVTQMIWRLKQGKNEAIYEIGLADDGTVIGLTRSEMDASLRTLELMASELGATVLVLKEIVITGTAALNKRSVESSLPSSSVSISSSSSCILEKSSPRPSIIDPDMFPPKSEPNPPERKLVFAQPSMEELLSNNPSPKSKWRRDSPEDDIPPFHLDLDNHSPIGPDCEKKGRYKTSPRLPKSQSELTPEEIEERRVKLELKKARAAARIEQRRLDLIRGDGTNPLWLETQAILKQSPKLEPMTKFAPLPMHRHQPAIPSSLRLASPAGSSPDDLLHQPLDSLSLSFADVRTVTAGSRPVSPWSDTEHAPSSSSDGGESEVPPTGEMICVEALVVRKVQHAEEGEEEEDGWEWGGEEDGWGLGAEGEVEHDDDVDSVSMEDEVEDVSFEKSNDVWGFELEQ
ncbi:hypothetical protein TREMEDRAFT_73274 [Tremella mesenterica DSM 1558]|uniref:uncharacterized protein n=1 Tax=Tremella mesenterica (strain ATCC 24925 / CBS 8224 / DSM 1558 / NBRC 9311 / NRRL Y-6157 / RJB 2259-6 / UBC 559-6) TaxID=578456 RepID=UPI0003F496AE|nr:uncharacterized protein TREMEDRAFT_73274 [Tremella mesenterica DSM 1558]EIW71344.1 hypothetical protein TREMEDRAFT_73274 [Tremella mesenterica DSM 1558]